MKLLLLFSLLCTNIVLAQSPPVLIVYENKDAFNGLKKNPNIAPYLASIGEIEFIKGKERSSLRLYPKVGIYTIDSVYVNFPGKRAKAWRFSTICLRDYEKKRQLSVYYGIPCDHAFVDNFNNNMEWKIDKSKTKNILGIKCYFASATLANISHQIWFTEELPYKDGPFLPEKKYGSNLPGLVLEHTEGAGSTTTAVNIEFINPDTELETKVSKLAEWDKTPKPTYSPGQKETEDLLLINESFELNKWVPLNYLSEAQKYWLNEN